MSENKQDRARPPRQLPRMEPHAPGAPIDLSKATNYDTGEAHRVDADPEAPS